MKTNALTTRYAEALFEAAAGCGQIERIGADLELFLAEIRGDAAFRAFAVDGSVSSARKKELLHAVFGTTLHPYTLNYLSILFDKGRAALLADSVAVYHRLALEAKGQLAADLVTAAPVAEQQEAALAAALGSVYGKQIVFSHSVDPALLGGAVVRVGDIVIDGSVRTQLKSMRRELQSEA